MTHEHWHPPTGMGKRKQKGDSGDNSEQGEAKTASRLALPHADPRMYAAILAGTKTGDGRHRKDFEKFLKVPNVNHKTKGLLRLRLNPST